MTHDGAGKEIERLIDLMAKLPGLGPRSARRAVLTMIKRRDRMLTPLARALADVGEGDLAARLAPLLADDEVGVRLNAIAAAGTLRQAELLPALDLALQVALDRARRIGGRRVGTCDRRSQHARHTQPRHEPPRSHDTSGRAGQYRVSPSSASEPRSR